MLDDDPDDAPLLQAVGRAISDYAQVEFTLASILQNILGIDFRQAHAIFFAIQNTRARHELYQTLLELQFKSGIRKYWSSCGAFLQKLGLFRNALAHWHASVTMYVSKDENETPESEYRLSHPVPGSGFRTIGLEDLKLFTADCNAIRKDLTALVFLTKERPDALPEIFLKPISHRNQADLRPPPRPKAPQPQRPPSLPKLSKAQKRAKAKKAARLRAQATKGP